MTGSCGGCCVARLRTTTGSCGVWCVAGLRTTWFMWTVVCYRSQNNMVHVDSGLLQVSEQRLVHVVGVVLQVSEQHGAQGARLIQRHQAGGRRLPAVRHGGTHTVRHGQCTVTGLPHTFQAAATGLPILTEGPGADR